MAGTVGRMATSFRFARRRDGSLRLRVTVTGEHYEHLRAAWGWVDGVRSVAGGPWFAVWVLEGDRIEDTLAALEQLDVGPAARDLRELAAGVRARMGALQAAPPRGRAAPVRLGDAALRQWARHHLGHARGGGDPAVAVDGGALVVDELGIAVLEPAPVRVDVAHLTDACWTGVELKGERDSLARLPRQVREYGRVFDRCTLVTTDHHVRPALELVPHWWEVVVATWDGDLHAEVARTGTVNPHPQSVARAQLLWRDELWAELKARELSRGLSKATRAQLAQVLAEHLDADQMRVAVTVALAGRHGWLTDGGRGRVRLT